MLFKHIFWSHFLSNFFWKIWRQTNRYLSNKVNIWTSSGYFPFLISFFCWNEISKKSSREDTRKIRSSRSLCNFIEKETLPQMFSCQFCEISENNFSNRTPLSGCFWKMENSKADNIAEKFFTQVTGNRVSDHYVRNVYIKVFL